MHSVAFQLASTSTVSPQLPFLFFTKVLFSPHPPDTFAVERNARTSSGSKSRSVLSRTPHPFPRRPTPLPFPSPPRRTFRSQTESPFFSVYLKRPRCPLQIATTWNGPYRSMLYGAITSFAVARFRARSSLGALVSPMARRC